MLNMSKVLSQNPPNCLFRLYHHTPFVNRVRSDFSIWKKKYKLLYISQYSRINFFATMAFITYQITFYKGSYKRIARCAGYTFFQLIIFKLRNTSKRRFSYME